MRKHSHVAPRKEGRKERKERMEQGSMREKREERVRVREEKERGRWRLLGNRKIGSPGYGSFLKTLYI